MRFNWFSSTVVRVYSVVFLKKRETFDDFSKRLEGEEKGQQTTWWPGLIKDKSKS
jgi:hypothetical protein